MSLVLVSVHPGPSTAVAPGDRVLLCTDGLLEARDPAGAFFPLPEHLPGLAAEHDLDRAVDRLLQELDRHTGGGLDDEVAVLLARAEPVDHQGPAHDPAETAQQT